MEVTQEHIEAEMAHDYRLRAIAAGIEVEISLRDAAPLNAVLKVLGQDVDKAIKEFAYADLSDMRLLQDLQARVFRYHVTHDTLMAIVARGEAANRDIMMEESP